MSQYTTPIPAEVFAALPMVLTNHQGENAAFNVRVSAFDGDDGQQAFAIEVYSQPERIVPKDKRQNAYTDATQTAYYFNAEGGMDGAPVIYRSRYGS